MKCSILLKQTIKYSPNSSCLIPHTSKKRFLISENWWIRNPVGHLRLVAENPSPLRVISLYPLGQCSHSRHPRHLSVLPLMIFALVRGINWNFQREESNGRPGEDEFLKVKFSSKASGCSLRARIIGRLHKITASELNKRTIKHIFITNEYS